MPVISSSTASVSLHRPIALRVAKDVAFANAPFFRRENVADRHVADVDPVQSRVEIRRQFAIQKIHNDLAGRRRFHIVRPDGCGGIDDDDRQTFARQFGRHFFRLPFRAFVMIGQLRFRELSQIRPPERCVAIHQLRQTNAPDGARIDDAFATGQAGGFDDVARAFDVRRVHGLVIAQPQMVARRGVKAPIATGDFAFQQFPVAHVAGHAFELPGRRAPARRFPAAATPSRDARAQAVREPDSSR